MTTDTPPPQPTAGHCLVTGGTGFVGTHLVEHLRASGDDVTVVDPVIDINDVTALRDVFESVAPSTVYHLAGQASVALSWTDPDTTYRVNVDGTRHVLEIARSLPVVPRVLVVSSADVYGPAAFNDGEGTVDETVTPRPVSPYGASKLAGEVVARQAFDGFGVPVVIARSFNHIGAGQSDAFVVSAFARQIAQAERDGSEELLVGNLDAERDFLDVVDVVRAYRLLAMRGRSGATYNVASGEAVPIQAVLDVLLGASSRPLRAIVDLGRLRPVEVPRMVGDATALRADTGWAPVSGWREAAVAALVRWRDELDRH